MRRRANEKNLKEMRVFNRPFGTLLPEISLKSQFKGLVEKINLFNTRVGDIAMDENENGNV
ncbi:uncharacterized protein G2W53_022505 [Senna tora]|uniref:Uncharacterized protein n=1 Tax=Senna tora TaxID=362788 RepID=A0A834WM65_9FABA|nr:uncharacterized protein G2W53_022498 [Senna tora]KAF7824361.1 uncharacterized protein G2W53_022505 [Senna tora]